MAVPPPVGPSAPPPGAPTPSGSPPSGNGASAFRAALNGAPGASAPTGSTASGPTAGAPGPPTAGPQPLLALALELGWKRLARAERRILGSQPRLPGGNDGGHASAAEGRKSVIGIFLGLPGELAAFFRGRGKDGGRKQKQRQRRRRQGNK